MAVEGVGHAHAEREEGIAEERLSGPTVALLNGPNYAASQVERDHIAAAAVVKPAWTIHPHRWRGH